jgi:iron(III) transport system substrate-binding protein
MRQRSVVVSAAAALTALVLSACGGSPTSPSEGSSGGGSKVEKAAARAQKVYDKLNGMTGQARTDELVKMAEAEGSLSIYTSNTDIDALINGFEDAYDVDVSVYRANSETALQRVLQESKAGYFGNDVFETNSLELNVANKEGLLYPYKSELRDQVRKEGQADGWTASRFNVFVVGWNTKKLKAADLPDTIEGFADPKWKGKISLELGDYDWFTAMYQYYLKSGKSAAEVKDLFSKIAANAKVVKGHTVQGELLSAGQFDTALSVYSHTVDKAARDGAPVVWKPKGRDPVQPIVIRPNGIGLMKTAKNPAAATLFVDFELTEGQKIFAGLFRIGSIPTGNDPLEGYEVIAPPEKELQTNGKKWDDLYAQILEGGQVVDE